MVTKEVAKQEPRKPAEILAQVILQGNLGCLKPEEKVKYYKSVCDAVGLNPLTKPFDYIILNNKEVLYANKGCAEQLRKVHGVSLTITDVKTVEGVYVVICEGKDKDGRVDCATGAVNIKGLQGEALANAFMKCETKAKRRLTLSICGLNMLDETEVESIPGAQFPQQPPPQSSSAQGPAAPPSETAKPSPKPSASKTAPAKEEDVPLSFKQPDEVLPPEEKRLDQAGPAGVAEPKGKTRTDLEGEIVLHWREFVKKHPKIKAQEVLVERYKKDRIGRLTDDEARDLIAFLEHMNRADARKKGEGK